VADYAIPRRIVEEVYRTSYVRQGGGSIILSLPVRTAYTRTANGIEPTPPHHGRYPIVKEGWRSHWRVQQLLVSLQRPDKQSF